MHASSLGVINIEDKETDQMDSASTIVALDHYFFQSLIFDFYLKNAVDILCFIFRRYDNPAI